MMYEDEVTKKIAQTPEEEMLKHTVLAPWLEQLRNEHPERVQRMITDAANTAGVSSKDQIYDILMGTEEIQTCREDWCEIKAKKIAKFMEE